MNNNFKIESETGLDYSGPIDVLLTLINKEKLDITNLSLIKITNQFVEYINDRVVDTNELADFLYILSVLLLIKTKILLQKDSTTDEIEIEELKHKLIILNEIKKRSVFVQERYSSFNAYIDRSNIAQMKRTKTNNSVDMSQIKLSELHPLYSNLINDYNKFVNLEKKIRRKKIKIELSLRKKIDWIQNLIDNKKELNFNQLNPEGKEKVDVIVSFLAILEMTKNNLVELSQKSNFKEISIKTT